MLAFELSTLLDQRTAKHQAWHEFLRVPSLSMGIYHLKTGQADLQKPHSEDEVYYVVSGKASIRGGNEVKSVGPGSLIFVERLVEHRFFNVIEDLTLLVFFASMRGIAWSTFSVSGRQVQPAQARGSNRGQCDYQQRDHSAQPHRLNRSQQPRRHSTLECANLIR
jgi:mannose-6-phosphate isomerase-like protein (cupin superfamily)